LQSVKSKLRELIGLLYLSSVAIRKCRKAQLM